MSLGLGVNLSQHHIIWNAIQSPTGGVLYFRTLPKTLELVYLGFLSRERIVNANVTVGVNDSVVVHFTKRFGLLESAVV